MKRITLALGLIISGLTNASAQTLFNTAEYIDIGNIRAAHLVHGDMWWDPASGKASCEYPKGSGKHFSSTSSLWIGGYDDQFTLKIAAQKYRQSGTDFWPGPIDTGALTSVSYSTSQKWAKIWKVNYSQVDSFQKLGAHTLANTPLAILEWPAKGNPYAKGAGSVALTINQPMAPFVDANSDGLYNPLTGDYPLMKGDQMLWWVINDQGATIHNVSGGVQLGIDVKISAYAYHRNGTLDNVIFYEYEIKNHSTLAYNYLRVAQMADMDLGDAFDDYTGFDAPHRMGIIYNSKPIDGMGQAGSYGSNPPVGGIAIVEVPGDSYNSYSPAGSYMSYSNSSTNNGDPVNGQEMFNLMTSRNRVGIRLPGGMSYQYNTDSECVNNHATGDRRFVLASNDLTIAGSGTAKVAIALMVSEGGNCPNPSFVSLLATADTAFKYYWNPPTRTTTVGISKVGVQQRLRVYPNPATDVVFIEVDSKADGTITLYNAVGQVCGVPIQRVGNRLEIGTLELSRGVYTIRYADQHGSSSAVFVKE